jgi:predicted phosphodiesterase
VRLHHDLVVGWSLLSTDLVAPLAIIYDIHGNLPALEAVLADARAAGAEDFALGGDYALFGPFPAETIETLRRISSKFWIRGNVDRWTAHPDQAPDDDLIREAIDACRATLDADTVMELGALPECFAENGTLFCHASPISDMRSFLPEPTDDEDELLGDAAGVSGSRVVFGHTHLQFRRMRADGIELINPGSVGIPMDGDPRAAYALREGAKFELRRVDYDRRASVSALRDRYGNAPWAERSARRIDTGQP